MNRIVRNFLTGMVMGVLFLPLELVMLLGISGRNLVWARDNLDLRGQGEHQNLREDIRGQEDAGGSDIRDIRDEDTIRPNRECQNGGRTCMPDNRPTRDPNKDPRNYRPQPSSQPTELPEPTQEPVSEPTVSPTGFVEPTLTPTAGVGGEGWQEADSGEADESASGQDNDQQVNEQAAVDAEKSSPSAVGGPQVLGLSYTSSGYGIMEAVLIVGGLLCIALSKKLLIFGDID